ncbi:MAG: MerR family transcriptional regulator [Actinomycetota bacterium]
MSVDDTNRWLTPMEMADRCGVSTETLRYYEREGLLDRVARGDGNHRRYSADDVAWVGVLRCLRVTAMPIREMKRFAELVRLGDAGMADRVELLEAHRTEVLAQRSALDDAIEMIDHKIDVYRRSLTGQPSIDTGGVSTTPTLGGRGVRSRR